MLWPKKNSYKEFYNEKIPAARNPPPPHNVSNGPSLTPSKSLFSESGRTERAVGASAEARSSPSILLLRSVILRSLYMTVTAKVK